MRSKKITNKEFDEIGLQLEEYIEETFGITMDSSQQVELININLRILGMKKE